MLLLLQQSCHGRRAGHGHLFAGVKRSPGGVAVIHSALTVTFFGATDARQHPEWQYQSEANYLLRKQCCFNLS